MSMAIMMMIIILMSLPMSVIVLNMLESIRSYWILELMGDKDIVVIF